MKSIRLTVAQAVIKYLNQQYVGREGEENKFFLDQPIIPVVLTGGGKSG